MGFKDNFISFALVGLFLLAMISFGVNLSQENESNNTLLDNPSINSTFQSLKTNLSSFDSTSQGQRENFESELPTAGFGTLILFGILSAGRIFTGMIVAVFNIVFNPLSSIIGVDPVVLGVISSILVVVLILNSWRLAKAGD